MARDRWGYLFNSDPDVIKLVAEVMPYCAIFQVPSSSSVVDESYLTPLRVWREGFSEDRGDNIWGGLQT